MLEENSMWLRVTIEEMVETCHQWIMSFISQDFKNYKFVTNLGVGFVLVSLLVVLAAVVLSWAPLAQLSSTSSSRTSTSEESERSDGKSHLNQDASSFGLLSWRKNWGIGLGKKTSGKTALLSESQKDLQLAPVLYDNTQNVAIVGERRFLNFLPETNEITVIDDVSSSLDEIKEFVQIYPKKKETFEAVKNEPEALISLNMAIRMKDAGKNEKALKLFQHAMALNPLHPDILNHYGEFIEEQNKDFIKADHLYTRALIFCPDHSKAIVNRGRTLPMVEELDQKQLNRIDRKRDHLFQVPDYDPSLKRMKKEAYFQHIHHTVAIEGNTMTLAETRMVVETRMAVPGKSIMEHNEIIGLESALKYINNTLVTKYGPITIDDILEIHKRVLGHVDPVEAGTIRRSQVYVGDHIPPPPSELFDLMEDLIEWLNSDEGLKLHPVKFAALAHYKFVFIHPFMDGNGRTGRLLMNLILMRAGYPPVIIRKQDRSLYYQYLQFANEGDVRPFIRFIGDCTERTLDVYLFATEYGMSGFRALEGHGGEIKSDVIEV
ncbi:adenosine monophosphate-protein transferase FICD homolog [Limulus polyphemus]|uniref:Protein adenylyltransferase Fic n=1 Tax=Limulus polyphemus TaxID=6850 RepID=A0ABM1BPG6_LIMPO|nr:adenosine monophosphate-protein transferase FICD homolog [Limulus polyphemus]